MSGEIEAIGDVATGALVARAVEKDAGEGHIGGDVCLNCGTALIGTHCHQCGQAGHVHRTLMAFGHDLLHGVFHFEGKIWHTIPLLIWKPGELTRRYIDGERARFISPLALFLFMIFLMFAVFSATAGELDSLADAQPALVRKVHTEMTRELAEKEARVRTLEAQHAALVAQGGDPATIDRDLGKARKAVAAGRKDLQGFEQLPAGEGQPALFKGLKTNIPEMDDGIAKVQKNPALFLYKLQNAAYKYSWGLIPLSLPFVWAMFAWRREFKIYDHAVFVTYSLCFMALLTVLMTLIGQVGGTDGIVVALAMLVPPLHLYRQLRGTYRLGRANALVRTTYLASVSVAALITFVLLLLLLGVMG